jgi:plastocyanin/uncharacterized cupredoxin-like copper-binding protein
VNRWSLIAAAGLLTLSSAGCTGSHTPDQAGSSPAPGPTVTQGIDTPAGPAPEPSLVDPRKDGFEIGFGEFAVALESPAIRPGRVTFVIRNGGELVHGFEMEAEEEGDSSGPGSGDEGGFKIEQPTFGPGETIRLDLDLAPGVYKIQCYVANHSDIGMEVFLDVRSDAPKVPQASAGTDAITIQGFAFDPQTTTVSAGSEVTWMNADPAPHTVTAEDGSFDSGPLDQGGTFSMTFNEAGEVAYACAIHPTMKGTVTVQA